MRMRKAEIDQERIFVFRLLAILQVLVACQLQPDEATAFPREYGGSAFSMATNGTHGQAGTMARPFSFSMASTILATPVWLSTMSIVFAVLAVISDSM